MTSRFPGFPHQGLTFLRQLRRHNDRAWFQAHREDYERHVREPMTELVTALGGVLQGFAPELVTDPKRAIYRIHRDVRFSADKSPYKTQVAATFGPRGLPKHAGAGLYFHVEPDEVLVAGGVYMPGTAELRAIRAHVAEHSGELEQIVRRRPFRRLFGGLTGEKLSRAPKGYEPDHPAIEWLRYKQYLAWLERPARTACSAELFPLVVEAFVAMMPLIRFLNAPLRAAAGRFEDDVFAP
jgi:uncharacterized protein (TIGR02453 family)